MFKWIIPNSLFSRFILIIMIPTVMAQAIATYVFYNRHWDNVTTHMIKSLVGDVNTIQKLAENSSIDLNNIALDLNLNYKILPIKKFDQKTIPESLITLYEALKQTITAPINLFYDNQEKYIQIEIYNKTYITSINFDKKRIDNPTTDIFILWMTGTSALFFILSLIFSKNQIRPIIKLARAAEKFGKGQSINNFSELSGALEVRKATKAFLKMKERIEKQISQRTEMLTGISHDLRTPLTRIKLQLAMQNGEFVKEIEEDINEMENMINSYLEFAKFNKQEETKNIDISIFFKKIILEYRDLNNKIKLNNTQKITVMVKKDAFRRAIKNIIDNSLKYASLITISYKKITNFIEITIEDNGEGIAEQELENVFKPFYRIESSRNKETGGVGLGLAIAKDVILNHAGEINLARSDMGGLKTIITLPIK